MIILIFVYFIWGVFAIHSLVFSPLLHRGFIFLALLSAVLALKKTFISSFQSSEQQENSYISLVFLLFGLVLFWFGRVGIHMQMSNPEKVVHVKYSGFFSSIQKEVPYAELQILEWRYQIIRGETPHWGWALYTTAFQKQDEEDPLVLLTPEDDVILTLYQNLETNSNNTSLLIDYDNVDVERTESFTALCTIIAREVHGDCKPPVKLPPRPIFSF